MSTLAKTLGIEWNTGMDHFRITIARLPPLDNIIKRMLVSDRAKTYDVLGWFSPTLIKAKILLQRLWEQKVDWDDQVPLSIYDIWLQWHSALPFLSVPGTTLTRNHRSLPCNYMDLVMPRRMLKRLWSIYKCWPGANLSRYC